VINCLIDARCSFCMFLISVGYETICINNHVEQLSVKTGKKVKDKDKVEFCAV